VLAARGTIVSAKGYEHRWQRLAPPEVFYPRVARAVALSLLLITVTLTMGTVGYHGIAGLGWLDAFHQASMLLSGMGPVENIKGAPGILFDSLYAIFCGVMLLASTAVMFAPVVHRILHRFHIEAESAER